MSDHDQRLKTVLKEFFPEFFELFFPEWRPRFDFTQVEWLDQEVFPDPPEGPRQLLDLVARLPHISGGEAEPWVALVHVEIESADSVAPLRRRMHWYYANLRHRHDLPVLPLALYLQVGLNGIGTERYVESFEEFEILDFRYLYVGLPRLSALDYMESSALGAGLSGLMRIADELRTELKIVAYERMRQLEPDERRRFLLIDTLEANFHLSDEQQAEFDRLMNQPELAETKQMLSETFQKKFDQGYEQGVEQGVERALIEKRKFIAMLLEKRFGPLPTEARDRLNAMTADELNDLGLRLLDADSLADLHLTD